MINDLIQLRNEVARNTRLLVRIHRLIRGRMKGGYSVAQFARLVGRSWYTIREYAAEGRIEAKKVQGRGKGEWRIPARELARFEYEGPMPAGHFGR
jgi:hypothetical protein